MTDRDAAAPNFILVGYTCKVDSRIWNYLSQPTAPSNYGEEAAAKWEREKGAVARQKIEFKAAFSKALGVIDTLYAIDPQRQEVFDGLEDTNPVINFVDWLLKGYPNAFPDYLRDNSRRKVAFFGFHVKEFVRMVGAECARQQVDIPRGLWQLNEDCHDPYDKMVENDLREHLSVTALLNLLGIPTGSQPGEPFVPHVSPLNDVRVTQEIITKGQLVHKIDNESLQSAVSQCLPDLPVAPPEVTEEAEDGYEYEYVDEEEEAEVEEQEETPPKKVKAPAPKKKSTRKRSPAKAK